MLTALMCFVSFFLHAQKLAYEQVPSLLSGKFSADFPKSEQVKWEKKKEHYQVDFKIGKISHSIRMSADGKISRHLSEMKKSQLPSPVVATVSRDFPGYTIGDCEKIEELTTVSYKVELKSEAGKKNVHFTPDGKVIPKKEQ